MRKVYLDYSATTPVAKAVLDEMMPYFSEKFGNANSMHAFGQEGAYAVDEARRKLPTYLKLSRRKYILLPAVLKRTTGRLKALLTQKRAR